MKILTEAMGVEYEWLKDGKEDTDPAAKEISTPLVTRNRASSVDAIQTHSLFSSRLKQSMEEKGLSQGAL